MKRSLTGLVRCRYNLNPAIQHSTLLPFLYETRSIRQFPKQLHLLGTAVNHRQAIPLESSGFEAGDDELDGSIVPSVIRERQRSTLTPVERSVFEQIYQDVTEQQVRISQSDEGAVQQLIKDATDLPLPDGHLSSLFDRALSTIREAYFTRAKVAEKTLRISKRGGSSIGSASTLNSTGPTELVQNIRNDSDIESLLTSANSDRELWQIIQKEIFAPVRQFVEAANSAPAQLAKARPLRRADGMPAVSTLRWSQKQRQEGQQLPFKASSLSHLGIGKSLNKSPELAAQFAKIQTTFAYECWAAQRQLRLRFPQSSYATAILPTIKELGPISYVLGASTELYNEILFLRWAHYRDLHACADLRAEMLDRGVLSNQQTMTVFRDAALGWLRTRGASTAPEPNDENILAGQMSTKRLMSTPARAYDEPLTPFERAWWSLEGIQSGFRRWMILEIDARLRRQEEAEAAEWAAREEAAEEREDLYMDGGNDPEDLKYATEEVFVHPYLKSHGHGGLQQLAREEVERRHRSEIQDEATN